MYLSEMYSVTGIFWSGEAGNDLEKSEKVLNQHFLHFSGAVFRFSKDNTPVSYISPKSTRKVVPIPSKSFRKFWRRKKSSDIEILENKTIFDQIGHMVRLGDLILTTNTIFWNLKSMQVQWTNSFSNLKTS